MNSKLTNEYLVKNCDNLFSFVNEAIALVRSRMSGERNEELSPVREVLKELAHKEEKEEEKEER